MPFQCTLLELSEILNCLRENTTDYTWGRICAGISTDTRTITPNQAFLALRGEQFDGHRFLDRAVEKGAIALIVENSHPLSPPDPIPVFRVDNTLEAYQKIAQWWRKQFSIPVIAITGSVGKTTTKELIAAVLSTQGRVHKTEANYNNEIGVPKTLLDLSDTDSYAVIEMAMRARGEIAQLTAMTSPTIGVITNVGTAHIGRLGGEDAIAEAKCELLATMPQDSIAILNHDNQRLINKAKTLWKGETLTYGLESGDIQGRLLASDLMEVEGNRFSLPLPGRHNALNYLGALAVAKILGIDWQALSSGISVNLPGGRAQCYQLAADILLLDETYNAGLESMLAALDLLKATPGTRHIAVLGAMKELGEYSAQFHFQVGERVKQLGLDGLFVLVDDPASETILVGAGKGEGLKTHGDLIAKLKAEIRPGDRLLFKASHSVGLDRVVAALAQTLTI